VSSAAKGFSNTTYEQHQAPASKANCRFDGTDTTAHLHEMQAATAQGFGESAINFQDFREGILEVRI